MSPITLMRRFTEDIDRAFGISGSRGSLGSSGQEAGWIPRVEVRQSGNNLVVNAELPGLNENEVRVEATDEGLVIEGERSRQQENDREGWHHSEFSYGRFFRLIPLPENAKIDQARANFRNGVLEVTVPVPEEQNKRRQIPVGTSGETKGSEQAVRSQSASAGRS
jgi:HSP20 family protein